jgi:hypothetical protein
LAHACRESLSKPDIKAAGRAQMRSAFYANEGKSAPYMADLIRRIGRVSSVYSPKWQYVLDLASNNGDMNP